MANAHENRAFDVEDGTIPIKGKDDTAMETQSYARAQSEGENLTTESTSESICEGCSSHWRGCTCSGRCVKDFIFRYVPIIRIMSTYNVKTDFVSDLTAGFTIGIMQIPQGMAYALLASLPTVYGLYTSFWPVLIYFVFGTSNHISMGTFAITSLLTGSIDEELCTYLNDANSTNSGSISPYDNCKIGVACSIALVAGVFLFILGVLKLGWLTVYLSTPLTRGFTTGSAIHVIVSQMKHIFGLSLPRYSGPLNLVYTSIEFFQNITASHAVTILISIITCLVLALTKEFFSPWFKKKIKIPFPVDLIAVIVATVISYLGSFNEKYGVDIVSDIPTGIPAPTVPGGLSDNFIDILPSAISIAIVGFANSMSLAKLFSQKHGYHLDSNQELLAHGLANTGGSFFNCFYSGPAMSRTLVYEASGAVTQLTGAISCLLILLVLLVLAPLFSDLPKCILACIIIVALRGVFIQFFDVPDLWKVDKIDTSIWVVTFLATVLLDVDLGLMAGVIFSLLTVIYRTQRPHAEMLNQDPQSDIYKSGKFCDNEPEGPRPQAEDVPAPAITPSETQEQAGIRIFRFECGLYYANHENFAEKLFLKTGLNPHDLLAEKTRLDKKSKQLGVKHPREDAASESTPLLKESGSTKSQVVVEEHLTDSEPPEPKLHTIILDCSMMAFIDSVGVNALSQIIDTYNKVGTRVCLASCRGTFRRTLDRAGFYSSHARDILFATVQDAVTDALSAEGSQHV